MQLRDQEVALLRRLRDELHAVVEGGHRDDEVTQRLYPATVDGDDEADAELRGMIHEELRESRLSALDEFLGYLDRASTHRRRQVVDLVEEEPVLVLGVLNDMRVALGARVGYDRLIDRQSLVDLPGHLYATVAVMDLIGSWQEQLLVLLDPSAAEHYDHPHDLPEG